MKTTKKLIKPSKVTSAALIESARKSKETRIDSRSVSKREESEAKAQAKAKAKASKARARRNAAEMTAEREARKAEAEKAKAKLAEAKAKAALEAQAKASERFDPKVKGAPNAKRSEVVRNAKAFLAAIGVKSPSEAHVASFDLSATTIKLLPLGKCAGVIALAIGAVPQGESVVTPDKCKEAYPSHWPAIRDAYNAAAGAFKAHAAKVGNAHLSAMAYKASMDKKGNGRGTISTVTKVTKGAVIAEAVTLNKSLTSHAVAVAITRYKAPGSASLLEMRDLLRVLRSKAKRTEAGGYKLPVTDCPPWMNGQDSQAFVRRLDGDEKLEVILTWFRGAAKLAAGAKASA